MSLMKTVCNFNIIYMFHVCCCHPTSVCIAYEELVFNKGIFTFDVLTEVQVDV